MLTYDKAYLVRGLARVPLRLRAAFATACVERLFPQYERFCERAYRGDRAALAGILRRIWDHLLGAEMDPEQIRSELARCMSLIPGEDDEPWVDGQAYAEDAASAIAYALRTLENGEPQEAAWAAQCAYEALDSVVVNREGIDTTIPGGERRVLSHPLVQAELARQQRDLDELLTSQQDPSELIARLRDRARAEAAIFFGLPS